ncbi:hypothetical protein ACRYJU_15265 [Alloalcanivorax xenomutans]|uniref:hypothetical protein n=1 Tax=Alloalcanivorax xenomutans TaxID=1094342 RepID=UPI003D9B866A
METAPTIPIGGRLPSADFVIFFFLLPFVVVPLDGEEHARAEHDNLERKENYRDPIHHSESFQAMT